MPSDRTQIFTTPEGRAKVMAAYEVMLSLWPAPHQSFDIQTRYGNTHFNAGGPEDAPPLVLLHAAGLSSMAGLANIGALSQNHREYAVDIIGDTGKSRVNRLLKSVSDHAEWLKDVFDGLSLERTHLIGQALIMSQPELVNARMLKFASHWSQDRLP